MNPQSNFSALLFGGQPAAHFFAMLFFCLFAATFSLLAQATARDVESTSTPKPFSLRFLVEHNWKRCLLSLMAILIGIRFLPDLDVPVIGGEMTPVKALGLGLGLDKFVQYLKDRTNLLGQKKTA